MIEHRAIGALAVVVERPRRIRCDDTGAESGSDQGMKVGDAAAESGPRSALFALLRNLCFTDSTTKDARRGCPRLKDLVLEGGVIYRAEHARLIGEILVDPL